MVWLVAPVPRPLAHSELVVTEQARVQRRGVGALSGGWKMKLALSRAILQQADILLLDEPTNHLDVANVKWLMDYLMAMTSISSMIVSHDSNFLETVCTHIIHYENRKLKCYRGNLTEFVKQVRGFRAAARRILYSVHLQCAASCRCCCMQGTPRSAPLCAPLLHAHRIASCTRAHCHSMSCCMAATAPATPACNQFNSNQNNTVRIAGARGGVVLQPRGEHHPVEVPGAGLPGGREDKGQGDPEDDADGLRVPGPRHERPHRRQRPGALSAAV